MVAPQSHHYELKKPLILLTIFGSLVALVTVWGCASIRRNADYRQMISAYSSATPVPEAPPNDEQLQWNVDLPTANGVVARIQARDHMDAVKLHYGDEPEPRNLYRYVDYSNPVGIRRDGPTLFVCWAETLFRTNYWLLEYDLERRRETQRRLVDPKDLSIQ
jgi:hypothetical protein